MLNVVLILMSGPPIHWSKAALLQNRLCPEYSHAWCVWCAHRHMPARHTSRQAPPCLQCCVMSGRLLLCTGSPWTSCIHSQNWRLVLSVSWAECCAHVEHAWYPSMTGSFKESIQDDKLLCRWAACQKHIHCAGPAPTFLPLSDIFKQLQLLEGRLQALPLIALGQFAGCSADNCPISSSWDICIAQAVSCSHPVERNHHACS